MSSLPIPYLLPMAASLAGALLSTVPVLFFEEIVSVIAAGVAVAASGYLFFMPGVASGFVYVDGLTKIMNLTVSLIYLGSVVYSITYLKHLENPLFQKRFYYFLMNAFAMSMLFSVSAGNLGLIWVGIEATTVTSALLVATENNDTTIEASWRYVIIVSSGLVVSLLSIALLYAAGSDLNLSSFLQLHGSGSLFTVGALLAVVGYGDKGGALSTVDVAAGCTWARAVSGERSLLRSAPAGCDVRNCPHPPGNAHFQRPSLPPGLRSADGRDRGASAWTARGLQAHVCLLDRGKHGDDFDWTRSRAGWCCRSGRRARCTRVWQGGGLLPYRESPRSLSVDPHAGRSRGCISNAAYGICTLLLLLGRDRRSSFRGFRGRDAHSLCGSTYLRNRHHPCHCPFPYRCLRRRESSYRCDGLFAE